MNDDTRKNPVGDVGDFIRTLFIGKKYDFNTYSDSSIGKIPRASIHREEGERILPGEEGLPGEDGLPGEEGLLVIHKLSHELLGRSDCELDSLRGNRDG